MAFDGSTLATADRRVVDFTDSFTIAGNDVDIVAIEVRRGHLYEFDVDGDTRSYLRLFDPFGNRDFANTDGFLDSDESKSNNNGTGPGEAQGGGDPYTRYVAQYDGVLYVAISPDYLQDYVPITLANRPIPSNPLPPTTGTLTVTDLGAAQIFADDDSAPIAPLALADASDPLRDTDGRSRVEFAWAGSTTDNFVNFAGDRDVIRVALSGGDLLVIDVNSTFGDSRLEITDSAGNVLVFDENNGDGGDAELIFAVDGEFEVKVTSLTTDGGAFDVVILRNPTVVGRSQFADFVDGTPINDFYVGLSGNDTLIGLDGNDTLSGGDGEDFVSGGENEDELFGDAGNDTIEGRAEDDLVFGGTGDDRILGDDGFDYLSGDDGNDNISGGKQNDTLFGGAGDDSLVGNESSDQLFGGDGSDVLRTGESSDLGDGGAGDDTLLGSLGNDTLRGDTGDDLAQGDESRDQLEGGEGNDTLIGGTEADRLNGGGGTDSLEGGTGADLLEGGDGADTLIGGGDRDSFRFSLLGEGIDVIADFTVGTDVIDVGRILPRQASAATFAEYVLVADDGLGGSLVALDPNGARGGVVFTVVAQVTGVSPGMLADPANFLL